MLRRLCLLCVVLALPVPARSADPEMKAHFIDVGQGAATLLEFPCGAMLIDTGAQDDEHADRLATYLTQFFSDRPDLHNTLDVLVISHPHIDHTRGIEETFRVCRVLHYLDNGIVAGSGRSGPKFVRDGRDAGTFSTIVRGIDDAEIIGLESGTGLTDGIIDPIACPHCDPQIRILSGAMTTNPGWQDRDFDNLNNHSVVVRVDFGAASFLFTGDLETDALETLVDFYQETDLLDVDVYLVGHHASHNGTTQSLLEAMTPELAVIGVGKPSFGRGQRRGFNTFSYGHPRKSVIELLSNQIAPNRTSPIDVEVADGARDFSSLRVAKNIYATGWDGDVTVTAGLHGTMAVATQSATRGIVAGQPAAPAVASRGLAAPAPAVVPLPAPAPSAPYQWNSVIPEKRPAAGGNGKLVLFDNSHGETAGQADWVIDGGFSDFADALVGAGFTVREYRGVDKNNDGVIRFFDDRVAGAAPPNEAAIELAAIQHADVFVMAEANRPLTLDERAALLNFVASGKGLFLIADHYNADRNLNSWDATEVYNGYNRSTNPQFSMGPVYGDLRNPGQAGAGWLATNFGLRFRFNAINCKSGVSGILPPADAEQITQGVGPVLMAAGATLAIVDPQRAKGLVYFTSSDQATSWNSAVEGANGGLYFAGRDEGPYVAISKPNQGKAAFIGDSSPIEDRSPKYANEQGSGRKRLHNGWNDPGNASVLCLNLVRWLATPENYVGFDSAAGHPAGFATISPLAPIEQEDPDDGLPWRTPAGGYDPWNTDTFAPGSFGAPLPAGSSGSGGQTPTTNLTVTQALAAEEGEVISVTGVIFGELNDQFGLQLAEGTGTTAFLSVQIPSEFRDEFSPRRNPSMLGRTVRITGKRGKYMGLPGLRNVQAMEVVTTN